VDAQIHQASKEIDAVQTAVGKVTAPPVPRPTLEISRKRKPAPNVRGMVVSREDSDALTLATARAPTEAAALQKDKENAARMAMWEKNRPEVRRVQSCLATLGTPAIKVHHLGLDGMVGMGAALVVGRWGGGDEGGIGPRDEGSEIRLG